MQFSCKNQLQMQFIRQKKGCLHCTEQIDSLQSDHGLFWEYMDKILCILMEK